MPPAPLPIRAMYSVSELAKAAFMSRARTLRLLRKLGVGMVQVDRKWLVPIDELEGKGRQFWTSVRTAELRRLLT